MLADLRLNTKFSMPQFVMFHFIFFFFALLNLNANKSARFKFGPKRSSAIQCNQTEIERDREGKKYCPYYILFKKAHKFHFMFRALLFVYSLLIYFFFFSKVECKKLFILMEFVHLCEYMVKYS